jgi:hypothetical protein
MQESQYEVAEANKGLTSRVDVPRKSFAFHLFSRHERG